jgi:hypothetical protein
MEDGSRPDPPCLECALSIHRAGLRPVPISPGKKKPLAGEGWGLKRYDEGSLRAEWARCPAAGVGILLGDDGAGGGVVDLEVDDEEAAGPALARLFPAGPPDTLRFRANLGMHYLLRFSPRLRRYGAARIFGAAEKGETKGNGHYLGLELRIGTIDPADPQQMQSVVPPTPRDDGSPRQWVGPGGTLLLPASAFDDPVRILPIPESVFADLDVHARPFKVPGAESPPTWDVEAVKAAVLPHALTLAREWGLRVVSGRATAKGFWTCRALGREDHDPSAGFNERTGVYTDRAHGGGLSLFHLAVALGAYPDFPSAVNGLGERFGVQPAAPHASRSAHKPAGPPLMDAYGAYGAGPDPADEAPIVIRDWPDPPEEVAFHGPAGRLALAVAPYTEADPFGVLIQTLVGFGNLIGRNAYFQVGATRHYLNLFVCTAGPTALGRKGTAWDIVKMALSYCDPDWVMFRVTGGLVSGEGMIWEVRDEVRGQEEVRERGQPPRTEEVVKDPGVADKRLLAVETEMGGLLKVLTREGNTLSALIRQAWDCGMLRSMTKNSPNRATDAHISIVGHITEHEVAKYLSQTDAANGFANRFLWACVKQANFLPDGALIPAEPIRPHLDNLKAAAAFAAEPRRFERDAEARDLWHEVYRPLSAGRPGLLGAVTSRGVAQAMRLACLYAALDFSPAVRRPHLEAALAVWRYCDRSAGYIFGDSLGDKDADKLLSALRSAPLGLTRNQIRVDVFGRHKSADEVARILGRLLEGRRVRSEALETGGRPATVWLARDEAGGAP